MNFKYISAYIISIILHPLVIAFTTFWILIFNNDVMNNNDVIFIICLLFSNIIPIVTVLILRYKNFITDLDASIKEQRTIPLMFGSIYATIGFLLLYCLNANLLVQGLMFSYITNTLIIILITKYWKISIHTIGLTGPMSVLWISGYEFPLFMLTMIFLLGISRVIIKAHTFTQVFVGAILGFLLTFIQIKILFE